MRGMVRVFPRALAAALVACLLGNAPALADGPGLPRKYDFKRIQTPEPIPGGSFGWGVASADLTNDGKAELLVAQAQTGKGQIFVFNGATGAHIDTIDPPEKNPGNPDNETLAFVYVETMPDLGSCPGGDGPDADEICDDPVVGPGDGIPEIIAGSRNLKVNAGDGSQTPESSDPNIGRGYVFDGATRAVLKRIDMPPADRASQTGAPQFARLMMSLQGMAPCAGNRAENNGVGVGPCPPTPREVRIGDADGGGQPDIVVTARNFSEARADSAPTSQCRSSTAARCTSGKAWVYRGEQIAGTDPRAILETPLQSIQNPHSQSVGSGEFGGNIFRVGDVVGTANAPLADAAPDGRPDFVIAARNLDYPLTNPDPAVWVDTGSAYLVSGANGAILRTIISPEPQARSQFSGSFNSGRAVGDLGAMSTADILLGAPLQNARSTDDGKAWVFNGETSNVAGGGSTGSWQFASLTDPTPVVGGNFGGSTTGVGDLVTSPDTPANEVLIAGYKFDPATEASNNQIGDLHIMNATMERNLQTIPHPEAVRGDGFGVGLAPMGDLNGDGFLDIAASAYLANVTVAGEGLAYILTSNNTAPPPAPTPTPTPTPTPPPTNTTTPPQPKQIKPGACTNEKVGTEGDDALVGDLGGDAIFALGGDDVVNGLRGEDCLDGGTGDDSLNGGADSDRIVGGQGADFLRGAAGDDKLYGGPGADHLSGETGRDMLAGGQGSDVLLGGPGRDRLFGEGGSDRLVAGGGRNRIDGGRGDDFIDARNGQRDTIRCGAGRDTVIVDRVDRLSGCERILRKRRNP